MTAGRRSSALAEDRRRLILMVSDFPQTSETFIVSKFLGLLDRGWDVHVVCKRIRSNLFGRFPELAAHPQALARVHSEPSYGTPVRDLLVAVSAMTEAFVRSPLRLGRYVARAVRQHGTGALRLAAIDATLIRLGPDILHFEFGALAPSRVGTRFFLGTSITVSFRGFDANTHRTDVPDYYDATFRLTDRIHTLGESLWERVIERGCPPEHPHALIPPAVNADLFALPGSDNDRDARSSSAPWRLLSVGRLEWQKGYEYSLLAVRRLVEAGHAIEYRIAGDGRMIDALAVAVHQLQLTSHVTLLGALDAGAVRKELAWADLFVHPAVSEGFGNAVLEAQAAGLPVVATDAGGLPENVADSATGIIVPRYDERALAHAIARLMLDRELRRDFGRNGRRRVIERFNLPGQIDAWEQFYRSVPR